MLYEVRFTKEAKKDIAKLTPKLKQKLKTIIQDTISINPYAGKKLVGDHEERVNLSRLGRGAARSIKTPLAIATLGEYVKIV